MTDITMTEVNSRSTIPIYVGVRYHHRVQVPVVDTLNGKVDVTGQLGVECQRGLPGLRHTEVLRQDSGRTGDRSSAGSTDLLQHILLTHGEARQRLAVSLCSPVCGLAHT